jgi:glutamate---cysteine ligase / carboxylate-amine ligase
MPPEPESFTLGVEEEYQIIDATTRELCAKSQSILPLAQQILGDAVQPELKRSQIEIATPVCETLTDVRTELQRSRGAVIAAAAESGNQIAAAGTHPFSHWQAQPLMPKARYEALLRDYQYLARQMVIFGCHVHVGIRDRELAIQVMNRARIWLAPLLALTTNSPFWMGEDTGYASYRTEIWGAWPISGPPQLFRSLAEYESLVQALVNTGKIEDGTKIYWDIRLSERYPTLEFRMADVCASIDEAVMLAGLIRALAQTCYEQAQQDKPFASVRPELLRVAHWQAARYGLATELIDVQSERAIPAAELIEALLTLVRPVLESRQEWDEVSLLVYRVLDQGTGADRQRQVYQQTGQLEAVVDWLVSETANGIERSAEE